MSLKTPSSQFLCFTQGLLLLPLTLMASIYGMNFAHIPFAQDPRGFWIMMLIMTLIALGLMVWFKQRKWL